MFLVVYFFLILMLNGALSVKEDGYNVGQVHLAQGKDSSSMMISWITDNEAQSQVYYGTDQTKLNLLATGESSSYTYNYTGFGNYGSGVIHHTLLSNLAPSTNYFYQCGDFTTKQTSGLLSFRTLPAIGDAKLPQHFGVIGDLGQTTDSESTLQHLIENNKLGLILHAGDLSYADCQQTLWDSYGQMIENLSKERPWMVGPGNHEIELNSDGSMYLAFEQRYKMPAIKPAEFGPVTIPAAVDTTTGNPYCVSSVFQSEYNYGNSFYSFDTGMAHVIYLNPYSTTNSTSVQYKWLLDDLTALDRSVTPWVIVVMHCPWYNSNTAHFGEQQTVMMRDSLEPIFYKYR